MKNPDKNLGCEKKAAANAKHPSKAPNPLNNVIELDKYRAAAATKNDNLEPVIHHDKIASSISWSALRAHAPSESRNCKVAKRSTTERLLLAPCFMLHYVTTSVAALIASCLALLAAAGFVSSSLAFWGSTPFLTALAALDPTLKAFTYLFGTVALVLIVNLLLKPVRTLEFNKSMGVFWIERVRVFGWKVGESAQMPLAQAYALQIISCSKQGVGSQQKDKIDELDLADLCKVADTKHRITKYEVNVVFCNGERVNIINHANGSAIRQDAALVAEFLGIPIWDQDKDEFLNYEEPLAKIA